MSDYVQLILVVEQSAASQELLAAALPSGHASCVLIRAAVPYEPTLCRELVALVQSHNVAALLANDVTAVVAAQADGCHLDASEGLEDRYEAARAVLGPDAIVGVMPGSTRHAAMTLAESGADYVGYDVVPETDYSGLELMQWWAEIFEAPVVAFTDGDLDLCRRAIEAGPPDFLAVPLRYADDLAKIDAVATLIADCGQLPVAEKNAK